MSKFNQQKIFASIVEWQQSGLSKKTWCEQHNIPYSSFHYWYKRFQNQSSNSEDMRDDFVQLVVKDHPTGHVWCELVLVDGRKLSFHQPVPVDYIRNLLY